MLCCKVSPSRSANSRVSSRPSDLRSQPTTVAPPSGEEQGGGPSLTAARSANRHHLARKSSGDWTTGRARVRNTHRGFLARSPQMQDLAWVLLGCASVKAQGARAIGRQHQEAARDREVLEKHDHLRLIGQVIVEGECGEDRKSRQQ